MWKFLILCALISMHSFKQDLDSNITQLNCILSCVSLCEAKLIGDIQAVYSLYNTTQLSITNLNHLLFTMIQSCQHTFPEHQCSELINNNTIVLIEHSPLEKYCQIDYNVAKASTNNSYYAELISLLPGIQLNRTRRICKSEHDKDYQHK